MTIETVADLRRHYATPCNDVSAVRVLVCRTSAQLELGFHVDGNISRICLTPRNSPQALAELWRHTCFEAFVEIEGQSAYHEFNFAPSREWRVYGFCAYRFPAPLASALRAPTVLVNTTNEQLELDARIALTDLSAIYSHSPLRLGLSAVIESQDGSLSYWALRHATGKPDFHHADTFALRLEAPKSD